MNRYRAEQIVRWIEILGHGKVNPRNLWKHLAKRRGKFIYEYKKRIRIKKEENQYATR